MLQNISIKKLLYSIPFLTIVVFSFLYFTISNDIVKLEDKSTKATLSNKIIKQMLDARISEKNYIRRKDPIYAEELVNNIDATLLITQKLKDMFNDPQNDQLVANVATNIKEYHTLFKEYQAIRTKSLQMQKKMEKEANDVEELAYQVRKVQKKQLDQLLKNSTNINRIMDEMQEASLANKIVKELLFMRINEKNYIQRKDLKYKKMVEDSITKIESLALHIKKILDSPRNKEMINSILIALDEYKKAFERYSLLRENSIKILQKMKKEAKEAEIALTNLRKDQKQEKNALMKSLKLKMASTFIISGIVIIILILYLTSFIVKNLKLINEAAKDLVVGDGDLTKRININGENEIASIAKNINMFIQKYRMNFM